MQTGLESQGPKASPFPLLLLLLLWTTACAPWFDRSAAGTSAVTAQLHSPATGLYLRSSRLASV